MPSKYKKKGFKRGKKSSKNYITPYMKASRFGSIQRCISLNQSVHYFKRKVFDTWTFTFTTVDIPATTQGTASAADGKDIRLSQLTGVGDFTSLFDLYRINGIKISFLNGYTVSDYSDPTTANRLTIGVPTLCIVADQDDSSAPGTLADVLERPYSKQLLLDKKRSFYMKPKLDQQQDDGLVSYKVVTKDRPYVDMASANVVYNGIKFILLLPFNNTHTAAQSFQFQLPIIKTYYIEMRNPR